MAGKREAEARSEADRAFLHRGMAARGFVRTFVLAEGIETPQERDFLHAAGIDLMQGYLFCRPAFKAIGTIDPLSW